MNRRVFLKVTGLIALVGAVETVRHTAGRRSERAASMPDGIRLTIPEPGTYRIAGRVRLDAPLVEISGITHTQQISWSGLGGSERPFASFTTFEHFAGPGMTQTIRVRGGQLEGVTAVPMDFV